MQVLHEFVGEGEISLYTGENPYRLAVEKNGARVAVQGFGNVGSIAAELLALQGVYARLHSRQFRDE